MSLRLVVTQPFGDYAKGDRIIDPAVIQQVLVHHNHLVVKIDEPDAEQPPPDKRKT